MTSAFEEYIIAPEPFLRVVPICDLHDDDGERILSQTKPKNKIQESAKALMLSSSIGTLQ